MTGSDVTVGPAPVGDTLALRQRVLRPHETLAQLRVAGDDGPRSLHVVARTADGTVVGTASVWPEAAPWDTGGAAAWRLRGMATAEGWRGAGVGGRLLDAVIDHVAAHGGGVFWCNARIPAQRFYERAGLVTRGEPWDDPDIGPHVRMWRIVDAT